MVRLKSGNQARRERIIPYKVKTTILALAVSAAALAQGYPGQTGPLPIPGRRLPGTGIPIPGRSGKKQDKTAGNNQQPLPNFRGVLKQMDDKSLSVELGDNRVLDFKRTGSTKFFKAGDEVKSPKFNMGDQVSVEAQEDPGGYLTAVNVYWEKAGGGTASKPSSGDATVDTWKDTPRASTSTPQPVKDATVPPAADDPGPPRLRRGGAADPSREKAAPVPENETASAAPAPARVPAARPAAPAEDRAPTVIRGDDDEAPGLRAGRPKDDPLIRRAADTALEFTETLPSYVCTEAIARYVSETRPANFQPLDVVSTEVVYENGREDYRNIQINGKPTKKKIEETGGAWSTGEFGTVLINLFNPGTAASFHFRRDSRAGGVMAKMYDFEVDREHSNWSVHTGSQTYVPAYSGSVWIDPQTARVLRIEMQAQGFPSDFPTDHVESATDYANVRLGDLKQYLLPVHSENLMCQRGTSICSRNVIDFRNYHKYTGESSITFGSTVGKDK